MGRTYLAQGFQFDPAACGACPLRSQCVAARDGRGRTVTRHPQEALLQHAWAPQHSEAFSQYRKLRQVAEHRLARLIQLGVRQARYIGRSRTLCQLLMAATVTNLTLVATKMGLANTPGSSHDRTGQHPAGSPIDTARSILFAANWITLRFGPFRWLCLPLIWSTQNPLIRNRGFQPGF